MTVESVGVIMPAIERRTSAPLAAARDDADALLDLQGIGKRFPGVIALDDVDLVLRPGEVHVLFGENGAGKSTLISIIAGTLRPDAGRFRYRGRDIVRLTAHEARTMGISPVFQEFSLVPEMTVEENLFLGRELTAGGFLSRRAMREKARRIIDELSFDLDPARKVQELSRAHQQMVEIAKALLTDVRLLILDEPTASLTDAEAETLFGLIHRLKSAGVGIIYVSHRMREIRRIGDRITVLRDGRRIATVAAGDIDDASLVKLMTGRDVGVLFPRIDHAPGHTVLNVEHLTLADGSVKDVSVHVRAGEITGIAGLVGCGKSELVRAIYGLAPITAGQISMHGRKVDRPTPIQSLRAGICYFPSDRVAEGLALQRPIRENASMAALDLPEIAASGFLRRKRERRLIRDVMNRLKLRPPAIERAVGNLSGGNRQKVLLARGLTRDIRVFLFDEPTVGIDVGAKTEVYELMSALVAAKAAVVLVSSELPEILGLANRLYVMHRSRVVAELAGEGMNEQAVLSHFFNGEHSHDATAMSRACGGAA